MPEECIIQANDGMSQQCKQYSMCACLKSAFFKQMLGRPNNVKRKKFKMCAHLKSAFFKQMLGRPNNVKSTPCVKA